MKWLSARRPGIEAWYAEEDAREDVYSIGLAMLDKYGIPDDVGQHIIGVGSNPRKLMDWLKETLTNRSPTAALDPELVKMAHLVSRPGTRAGRSGPWKRPTPPVWRCGTARWICAMPCTR